MMQASHCTPEEAVEITSMLTSKNMGVSGGNTATKFPSLGSLVAYQRRQRASTVPPYVSVPVASSIGLRPGYFGGHMLGVQYDPFQTGGDPNNAKFEVQNLALAKGLSVDRLDDRQNLLRRLDQIPRQVERSGQFDALDRFDQQAVSFVSGEEARNAFDLSRESDKTRDRYGRSRYAQSVLLARRLIEADVSLVQINWTRIKGKPNQGGWDTHAKHCESLKSFLMPMMDRAYTALLQDLDERGLLETTLVVQAPVRALQVNWPVRASRSPTSGMVSVRGVHGHLGGLSDPGMN